MAQSQHVREGHGAGGALDTTRGSVAQQADDTSPASSSHAGILSGLVAHSPRLAEQRRVADLIGHGRRMRALSVQRAGFGHAGVERPPARAPVVPGSSIRSSGSTGLPDRLRAGIERLSGLGMDHVRVHYNSPRPGLLNAHAYAQGSEIHIAPGQERHLPHEAWHVVQQAQGRVKPTLQMRGGVPVNDATSLETEADVMGAAALTRGAEALAHVPAHGSRVPSSQAAACTVSPVQRMLQANVQRTTRTEPEAISVDDLKYGVDAIVALEFAGLLRDDSAALVESSRPVPPSESGLAMRRLLDAITVDPAALKAALIDSLMVGGDWLEADPATLDAIREAMTEQAQARDYDNELDWPPAADAGSAESDEGDTEEAPWTLLDVVTDHALDIETILDKVIGESLARITKIGDLDTLAFSEAWKRNLAYCAYEQTKTQFYSNETVFIPAVAPYLKLIRDINDGVITGLTYVRKYYTSSGPGAEFTVSAPGAQQTIYNNTACVHAHYAGQNKVAHYAHTKPWLRRYDHGYRYSIVDLHRFTQLNNTIYSAL